VAILGPLIPLVLHWLLVTSFKVILLDREKCLLVVAVINVGFALGRLFEFAGFRWLEKDVTIYTDSRLDRAIFLPCPAGVVGQNREVR